MLWACASLSYVPDRDWLALFYDAFDSRLSNFKPQVKEMMEERVDEEGWG